MRVNPVTGETDLSLFQQETDGPQNLTLAELRAVLPGMVQKAVREQLAKRQRIISDRERAAAVHADSGNDLALKVWAIGVACLDTKRDHKDDLSSCSTCSEQSAN